MDEREFDDFYNASYSRITGQVYAMIGNRDEAEECVQEAFVRAWAHRRKLDRAEYPEAWVRTTAYRLAVSRWRRTTRGRRPADRALVLHHLADLPVHQVAREVGVPEGTIKARLSRGRAALAALLSDDSNGGLQEGASHV